MCTRASVSRVVLTWLIFCNFLFSSSLGTPLPHPPTLTSSPVQLQRRDGYILSNNTVTGELSAIDPSTLQLIPQGPATDGGGTGFNAPAAIWVVFVLLVGLPLSFAGFRGCA